MSDDYEDEGKIVRVMVMRSGGCGRESVLEMEFKEGGWEDVVVAEEDGRNIVAVVVAGN